MIARTVLGSRSKQSLLQCAGLSLSFEAGVACKISPVTYNNMAKGNVNEGPKGLSFLGGSGGIRLKVPLYFAHADEAKRAH